MRGFAGPLSRTGVHIPDGAEIGYDLEQDRKQYTVSESGIVVVTNRIRQLEPRPVEWRPAVFATARQPAVRGAPVRRLCETNPCNLKLKQTPLQRPRPVFSALLFR